MRMQDAVQGREDFERLNSIMNGLIEDNTKPGWLEENPHSIAAHVLKLTDQHGKPLSRARLIQVPCWASHLQGVQIVLETSDLALLLPCDAHAEVSRLLDERYPHSTQTCAVCGCGSIAECCCWMAQEYFIFFVAGSETTGHTIAWTL